MSNADKISAIADYLNTSFVAETGDFRAIAVPNLQVIAVISDEYGLAIVSDDDDINTVMSRADRVEIICQNAGIDVHLTPFGISNDAGSPPIIIRRSHIASDIAQVMVALSQTLAPPEFEAIDKFVELISAVGADAGKDEISPHLMGMLNLITDNLLEGKSAWAFRVLMDSRTITAPDVLLPAILVSTALYWNNLIVASGGYGGITIKLRSNPRAILGHSVTGIEIASPTLFFVAYASLLRRCFINDQCWLDGLIDRYSEYMTSQRHIESGSEFEFRLLASQG